MFPWSKGNMKDKFITLVSFINSKVNDKIARAKSELTTSTSDQVTEVSEQLERNTNSITNLETRLSTLEELITTLETSTEHTADITNLNALINTNSNKSVNFNVHVYTDQQLANIELGDEDQLVYLKISDLTLYRRTKIDDSFVDTPIGRLTPIE